MSSQLAFQMSRQMEEQGNFENAMRLLDSCYSKEYCRDSVYFYRALFSIKNNKAKQADKACQRLDDEFKDSPLLAYAQGLISFNEKNYAKSVELFTTALGKNLFPEKILYNRSVAFGMLDDFTNAVADLDKLISTQTNYSEYYYSRAYWLQLAGKNAEAIEDYKKTIELDKQNFEAYLGLAYLYKQQDDSVKACETLNQAVSAGSQMASELLGTYCK